MTVIPKLIAPAIIISLLGFMEAISIAKAMAAKTRQRLDPNQELIGQGLSNMVGCVFQSYAVSGSFSRSAVNLQAGARTGLSNVFSSGVVMIVLLFLSPMLYYLPQAVLAAIIMMAVIGLLNVSGFVHAWRTNPFDGLVSVITFAGTLALAPHLEWGIFMGVALSLGGYLYRSMRPHVARLVPAADGTVRDADRHDLKSCRYVAVVGFDGPLNFASTSYLEDEILRQVADHPDLRYLLLSGQGITEIDASGEETLRHLVDRLRATHIQVAITDLSDKALDVLKRSHLYDRIGEENIFATDARAIAAIYVPAHRDSEEINCPFLGIVPRLTELSLHPDGSLHDAARYRLPLCRHIAVLRVESPINRANVRYVEEWIFERIATRSEIRHVLIVAHDITSIDTEGAQRLCGLADQLRQQSLEVSFSGVPDEVADVFVQIGRDDVMDGSHLFPTGSVAIASIWGRAHIDSNEHTCPLHPLAPQFTELSVHPKGGLRDAKRSGLRLCPTFAVLRLDSASGLAGHDAIIGEFDRWKNNRPRVKTIIFVCTALTRLEPIQAEELLKLVRHARQGGHRVSLCRLPDSLFEVLARTGVGDDIGVDDIYPSVTGALAEMWGTTHPADDDENCPLVSLLPHVTELSLHPDGSLRDARRHDLERCRYLSVVRFDGRLDYSTLGHFTQGVERVVEDIPDLRCLILAGHTLERIDEEAAEGLVEFFDRLRSKGLRVCVSGLRDEVIDVLLRTGVHKAIGEECIFPTQAKAIECAHAETHRDVDEARCPLVEVVPTG
jgi:MFS superfamily sulfate permease-like transporter